MKCHKCKDYHYVQCVNSDPSEPKNLLYHRPMFSVTVATRLPHPIKYVFSKAELLPRTDYLLGTSILNIAHVSSLIPPPTQCPIESVW